MPKTILLLMIFLLSCTKGASLKGNDFDRGWQDPEDFFVFFQTFCMDSSFQLERIKFPIVETYLSKDLNNTVTNVINRTDWVYVMIKEFKSNTFEFQKVMKWFTRLMVLKTEFESIITLKERMLNGS
jgi:hypothetical protein